MGQRKGRQIELAKPHRRNNNNLSNQKMLLTSRKSESIKHLPMNVIDYISRPGRAFFSPSVVCLLCLLIAPSCFAQVNDQVAELLHKGKTAFDSGQSAEALSYFTRASVLAPQIAEIKLNIALALKEEEKYPEEIAALQSALSVKPTLKGANLFLGVAYYRLDDYGKATQALKNELRRNPKDAQVLMWLGVVDLAAHNFKSAAAYLDQAAELAPKDADILYHRGRAHLLLSQDSYQKMYQSDPGSWRVHEVLAQAYSTADRQTEAISEYKEAIRLAPEETGLHLTERSELIGDVMIFQRPEGHKSQEHQIQAMALMLDGSRERVLVGQRL